MLKENEFWAIDVETANQDPTSVCHIGVAKFINNEFVNSWSSYLNPKCIFNIKNIEIHGIDFEKIKNEPDFPVIYSILSKLLKDKVIVHHSSNNIDVNAINGLCLIHDLPKLGFRWVNSLKILKNTVPKDKYSGGFGLKELAKFLNYEFSHHNAEEDAILTGRIMAGLCTQANMTVIELEDYVNQVNTEERESNSSKGRPLIIKHKIIDGNPSGYFNEKKIVFTGKMVNGTSVIAEASAKMGFYVKDSVNKETNFLVVGYYDGYPDDHISTKVKQAIKYNNEKKANITIFKEDEFIKFVKDKTGMDLL
ncbi:MAG TPA: hypothetical protein DCQ58_08050 [Saprospirales bacterium]|nr:hypothetical protein [Saprospirales bacterium]